MIPTKEQSEIKQLRKEMKEAKKAKNMTVYFEKQRQVKNLIPKKLSQRFCVHCKIWFQKTREKQSTCSSACAVAKGKVIEENKIEKNAKEERVSVKKELYDIKPFPELKKMLQDLVNEIARLIDKDLKCISCPGSSQLSGGHYWSVGSNDHIRFELHNIRAQCYICNNHKGGAPREYIEAVEKIHGKKYAEFVHDGMRLRYKDLRFDRPMILEAIIIARKERNKFKKLGLTYNPDERIQLRKEINKLIGIYI